MDILNDIEKDAVMAFLENQTMSGAVKKMLLYGIYYNGTLKAGEPANPLKNFAIALAGQQRGSHTDAEIGQDLRAVVEGIRLLEQSYEEMTKIKRDEKPKKKINDAR